MIKTKITKKTFEIFLNFFHMFVFCVNINMIILHYVLLDDLVLYSQLD